MTKVLTPVDFANGNIRQRNRVINGDMRISQENGDTVIPVTGTPLATAPYPADMFKVKCDSNGTININQQTTTDFLGFNYALKVAVAATEDPLASNTSAFIHHAIEGNNIADLMWGTANAKPVTLSFWVKSSLTGTYSVAIRNSNVSAYYISEYTIDVANTQQKVEITIPGATTGTWLTNENTGLQILWTLATASDYVTSEIDMWRGSGLIASINQVNLLANLNATFELTGVQLEVGDTATEFEHRPFDLELMQCKRCWEQLGISNTMPVSTDVTSWRGGFKFDVEKRTATPTMTYSFTTGTGATFTRDAKGGIQSGNHSAVSTFSVVADARLS